MRIALADTPIMVMGAAGKFRRPSVRRPFNYSRKAGGRNGETWEGAPYVRPPFWKKSVLRKRYLI